MMPKSTATSRPCASTNRFPGCMSAWKKPSRSAWVRKLRITITRDALGIVTGGVERGGIAHRHAVDPFAWSARGRRCGSSRHAARGNRYRRGCVPQVRTPPPPPCADPVRAPPTRRGSRPARDEAQPARFRREALRQRARTARARKGRGRTPPRCRDAAPSPPRARGGSSAVSASWTWAMDAAATGSPKRENMRVQRLAEFAFDGGARLGRRKWRQAVLQMLQRARDIGADDIGPRRQHLAELDMRGPETLQRARQALARRQVLVLRATERRARGARASATAACASRYSRGISASWRASVRAMRQSRSVSRSVLIRCATPNAWRRCRR